MSARENVGAGVNAVDHAAKDTHDEATSPQGVPAPAPLPGITEAEAEAFLDATTRTPRPHNHPQRVPGCHRCELTTDETWTDQ